MSYFLTNKHEKAGQNLSPRCVVFLLGVRTFKTIGKKNYFGKWSAVKSVKCK